MLCQYNCMEEAECMHVPSHVDDGLVSIVRCAEQPGVQLTLTSRPPPNSAPLCDKKLQDQGTSPRPLIIHVLKIRHTHCLSPSLSLPLSLTCVMMHSGGPSALAFTVRLRRLHVYGGHLPRVPCCQPPPGVTRYFARRRPVPATACSSAARLTK